MASINISLTLSAKLHSQTLLCLDDGVSATVSQGTDLQT